MNLAKRLFVILILFISCNDNKQKCSDYEEIILNSVEDYTNINPLSFPPVKDNNFFKNGFSYPSYQVYICEENTKILLKIINVQHFSPFDLTLNDSTSSYVEPNGLIYLNKKKPVIFFGLDKLNCGGELFNEKLIENIPDSLKFNEINMHGKMNLKTYEIPSSAKSNK